MHTVSPRVSIKTRDFLVKQFRSLNAGAEYGLEFFRVMYQHTIVQLNGVFSQAELRFIIEAMSDATGKRTPIPAGRVIGPAVAFSITVNKNLKIDTNKFLSKIHALEFAELAALEIWAASFLMNHDLNSDDADIEQYLSTIAN